MEYEDAWPLLDAMRAIKSSAELEIITRVNRATAEALDSVLATARPGESEFQLAGRVSQALRKRGAQSFCHTTLATGLRSGAWHATPSDNVLEEGMLLRTDWKSSWPTSTRRSITSRT